MHRALLSLVDSICIQMWTGLGSLPGLLSTKVNLITFMKHIFSILAAGCALFALPVVSSATPEQDKAFVDTYKQAFESSDAKKLESFLYTKNANPMALEFYKMMMTAEMGSKISKIELRALTPEETKKAAEILPSPDGSKTKLPVTPTKKLVISVQTADANGSSTGTSESFVAEVDGKLMIPVPATAN